MRIGDKWKFLLDAYTGEGGFWDGSYLVRHPRESDEKYARRRELAVYPNYVKKVVNVYIGHLFRQGPQRELKNEICRRFVEDADRRGTHLDDVSRRAMLLAVILGTAFAVVDKPREAVITRAEEFERRLFPYVVLRTPLEVASWKTDELGIAEISFRETTREGEVYYRVFDRESWRISNDPQGIEVVESGKHFLGRVPVVPLWSQEPFSGREIFGTPWIQDLAALNFDLYNALSELRELFRGQTFSILAIPVREAAEAAKYKDLTVSTENALPYNPEGGGKPEFIAPPEGPVRLYLEYVEKLVEHIYRLAGIEFLGTEARSGKSGVAFTFMFQEMDATLQGWAGALEAWEYRIAELVCAWEGEEFRGNITYNRRFNLVDLSQEFKVALDATSLQISPTFDRELRKRLSRLVLSDWGDETMFETIDREIEAEGDVYGARLESEAV